MGGGVILVGVVILGGVDVLYGGVLYYFLCFINRFGGWIIYDGGEFLGVESFWSAELFWMAATFWVWSHYGRRSYF